MIPSWGVILAPRPVVFFNIKPLRDAGTRILLARLQDILFKNPRRIDTNCDLRQRIVRECLPFVLPSGM